MSVPYATDVSVQYIIHTHVYQPVRLHKYCIYPSLPPRFLLTFPENMSTTSNKGASSALSRWCSHSRHISISNNLFCALIGHHLMAFGAGVERTRVDLAAFITIQKTTLARIALRLFYSLAFLPFYSIYIILLSITLFVNEGARIVEQFLCVTIYIFSFGTLNFTRMASFYSTFMLVLESLIGRLWHDSTIIFTTPRMACDLCASRA